MKETIQTLVNLTEEQIKKYTPEEANTCLEKFKNLDEVVISIWNIFKLFDPGANEQRTLQLLNNHASGIVIREVKNFKDMSSRLFPSKESLVQEGAFTDLEKYQTMASNYSSSRSLNFKLDMGKVYFRA